MIPPFPKPYSIVPRPYSPKKSKRLPKVKTKAMTLCVAAVVHNAPEPHIVTVCDTMISGAIISADATAIKIRPFHKDWTAMLAADDITQAVSIISKAEGYFEGRKNTLAVARAVFKRAFQRHLIEMREDAVLSTYHMTMDEFKKTGRRRFTENKFADICKRIEEIDTTCSFIVNGFDHQGIPHIFEVSENGIDKVYDVPGFCCIGSGRWSAELILYALRQSLDRDLEQTIFNVCAAKFMAEKRGDVGQATFIHARKPGSFTFRYNAGMIEDMRELWEKSGCPRVPGGVLEALRDIWHPRCL